MSGSELQEQSLSLRQVRRLALARAGLLKPRWTGMPQRAAGRGKRARSAALQVVSRFGYLQLDTVSVAGARSHAIVLMSRIDGLDPTLGEEMLRPGEPLFEYWGHEASWIPIELYPAFEFRRREFRHHPWWGDLLGQHPEVAEHLKRRIRDEGPLRSVDLEGASSAGWWDLSVAKRVATTLWSNGELAIRQRRKFQRTYDLARRVIPPDALRHPLTEDDGIERLILKALDGHGWATLGTIAATWRLKNRRHQILDLLRDLRERHEVERCDLRIRGSRSISGWIRPRDLDLAARLESARPRRDRGVLLSPFDPVLWDRQRVLRLFGFEQALEIYKPVSQRVYGYFCLPVLAGENLIARVDLKANRQMRTLSVLACHYERTEASGRASGIDQHAVSSALDRFADSLELGLSGVPEQL